MKRCITTSLVLFVLGGIVYAEDVPGFRQQSIVIPKGDYLQLWEFWQDINSDGLTDLLIHTQNEEKVFIYIQNISGFPEAPTQTITLPPNTMWFALFDISEYPGNEMLISTSKGLFYYRQNNGFFEIKLEKLIEAEQAIPQNHPPTFRGFGQWSENSKYPIPIVFSDHTVIYERDENYQLKPKRKIQHEFKKSIIKNQWHTWTIGSKTSSQLWVTTKAREKSEDNEKENDPTEENEYIEKLYEKIKEGRYWHDYGVEEKDINADNKIDLVLWYQVGGIDAKTIITVFIRQENGRLPEKPNQVLRCQGFAIDIDSRKVHASVLNDIDNDGFSEIVLASLKTKSLSASSIVEAVVSRGLECTLSIRSFKKHRGYSNKADFKLDITTVLPFGQWVVDFITLDSDFNGDGSKDLRVRRSPTRCEIYLSLPNGVFFDSEPKLQLEVPAKSRMFVEDLNNDGISDIYVIDYEKDQIAVFLSKPMEKKGAF